MILNDELLREAKRRAADEGTTLKAVLEKALRAYLGPAAPRKPYRLRWRTEKGQLQPGVPPIHDTAALLDFMDGIE